MSGGPSQARIGELFERERERFAAERPASRELYERALMHLWMLNRGVLMTPFHMMALISPATTEAEADAHTAAFAEACAALAA